MKATLTFRSINDDDSIKCRSPVEKNGEKYLITLPISDKVNGTKIAQTK